MLKRLGFAGGAFKKSIRFNKANLDIPEDIGELDFLGYSRRENLLILAEFKIVEEGTEPKLYRDSVAQFVRKRDNYADRFRKKINWLRSNRDVIGQAFSGQRKPSGMGAAMITLYPTFASFFISDFPCVDFTHFCMAYERKAGWPYPIQ